ncbi:signal peptidase II [candidate division WOR-3 bacterium]|nr:signal peptidase II [candidate division WOR-3 bacterium]
MLQKRNAKLLVFFLLFSFVLDQITKLLAVNFLRPLEPATEIVGSLLRLKLTFNPFGVFGISFGSNELYYVFSLIGIVVLVYIALTLEDRAGVIVFGLLIGGAIGNVIDRMRFGYVIDFIDMGIGHIRWFTYNLADAFITVGAVFLLVREVFYKKKVE